MQLKSWLATHWFITGLVILTILSAGLRFYQLGSVPHGMTWDEAAIGYDGWAVWTAHRDEWLKILPISFKSFGDYKAPLAIYITGLFEVVLGLKLWVVRLPFALSGIIGVVGMVFLTRQLLKLTSHLDSATIDLYGLVAGFATTLSPWHLHFTRIGMESGMAMTLIVLGIYLLLKFMLADKLAVIPTGLSQKIPKKLAFVEQPITWLLSSAIVLTMSLYVYHSTKLATPLLLLLFGVVGRKTWLSHKKETLTAIIVGGALLVPLMIDSVFGHGADRLSQALIPIAGRSVLQIATQLAGNLAIHFSPAFLVMGLTPVLRHGDGTWGVLLWPVFLLALLGILTSFWSLVMKRQHSRLAQLGLISFLWILIGYIPAVIGWEVPHANRTLLALPGWIWLAVAGWDAVVAWADASKWSATLKGTHGEGHLLSKTIIGLLILTSGLFFITYQHNYYTVFAAKSASDFQDGYNEMYQDLKPYFYNDPSVSGTDKILISTEYGQPYIFALFNYKMSPVLFNQGGLNKIEFDDVQDINTSSLTRHKTVVVATASDKMPWDQAVKLIYGSDGTIRFGIFVNSSN